MDWKEFSQNFNVNFSEDFRRTFKPRRFEKRFVIKNLAAEAQNVYSYFEISLNGENYVSFNFERGRDFRNTFANVCENVLNFVNTEGLWENSEKKRAKLKNLINKPYILKKIGDGYYLFFKKYEVQKKEKKLVLSEMVSKNENKKNEKKSKSRS